MAEVIGEIPREIKGSEMVFSLHHNLLMYPKLLLNNLEPPPTEDSTSSFLIVAGTSLAIADLERFICTLSDTMHAGGRECLVVWINYDPPPSNMQIHWDVTIQGDCEAIAQLVIDELWPVSIPGLTSD